MRVEAGRLRSRLEEYYNGDGAKDDVRIVLPRGGYSAQFERRSEPVVPPVGSRQPQRRGCRHKMGGLGARYRRCGGRRRDRGMVAGRPARTPGTSIAVLAFDRYLSSGEDESVAAQVTDGVTSELAKLGTLSVVSHTSAMQFAGERKPLRDIAAALNAEVIVEGSIQNNPDGIVVMVRLVNAHTDRKVWVENFPGRTDDIPGLNRRIATATSAAVLERFPAR